MTDSDVLNERQAASVLGCSVALTRKWRLYGAGPSYLKIGRLVRYRQADIDSFLEAHRVETAGGR
jgi:predicted DNA-binding transcriptional regulator AlpA